MSTIRSYKELKTQREIDKKFIEILIKNNVYGEALKEYTDMIEKDFKKDCREFYKYQNEYCIDPLSVPLRNNVKEWRTVADKDTGDSCTDFIIIPDKWGSLWDSEDEEDYQTINDDIEDFVFSTVGYSSGYDFPTGKMITLGWSFKRIPAGVAVIHYRGIDW